MRYRVFREAFPSRKDEQGRKLCAWCQQLCRECHGRETGALRRRLNDRKRGRLPLQEQSEEEAGE